jgi:hypothetical protein
MNTHKPAYAHATKFTSIEHAPNGLCRDAQCHRHLGDSQQGSKGKPGV